jgi:hypothetical protein
VKWAVGITAVEARRRDLLPRTLASLRAGGFDSPRLFVDGCADPQSWAREFKLEVTPRWPTIRTYGNWILSLGELYIREPAADFYFMGQDDFVMSRNVRPYIERRGYPDRGYLNCYTFPSNQTLAPKGGGWYESRLLNPGDPQKLQTGRGAVALVFSREAVQVLLTHQHMVERPTHVEGWRRVDGGVVTAMNKAGWREYVHSPSLVQHTGKVSSMRNRPHPSATSFMGEEFDCLSLLRSEAVAS